MDAILSALNSVGPWILAHDGTIMSVLGFLLLFLAKVFPNANANPVIALVQKFVDLGAKLCFALGGALKALADLLGNIIKSDGLLGKK
jgi:hypothetical protein